MTASSVPLWRRFGWPIVIVIAALPIALWHDASYALNILAYTYLFAGLALAWNLIGGFGGQFSLGHGAFFGVGAYGVAGLYLNHGWSPIATLLPVALIAAVAGWLLSWPTFRLRGPFFAIATMAMNEVFFALANYFESITGGPAGLSIPFVANPVNFIFEESRSYTLLMYGFMLVALAVSALFIRSRIGHYLIAVREDEDAAAASGVNVLRVKCIAMAVSAGLTAIGGGLFAMYVRIVDPPSVFTLADTGLKFALLPLIGGAGTLLGPIVGAGLIVPLETVLRGMLSEFRPGLAALATGAVMIVAALYLKNGIVGAVQQGIERIQRRRGRDE
ncbi:branched-chain amino acid ABC transporter permease [soil metagenome]